METKTAFDPWQTDERILLRQSVRDAIGGRQPIAKLRELAQTDRSFDREFWRQMGELGWLGVALPESAGGGGADAVDQAVILEELGRGLVNSPYIETAVVGGYLLHRLSGSGRFGNHLPRLASGNLVVTTAFSDDANRCAPGSVTSAFSRGDTGYTVDGRLFFVVDAREAEYILVAARDGSNQPAASPASDGSGVILFALAPTTPGVELTPLPALDARHRYEVRLRGVRLEADAVVGEPGAAWPALHDAWQRGAAATALDQAGAARHALEIVVDYVKNRVQFGQVIGSFQAIKHRCADLMLTVECMEGLARAAAEAMAGGGDLTVPIASAKAYCSDGFQSIASAMIQLHGGIGFTWEHDTHLFVRRAQMEAITYGDSRHHRETVAHSL